MSDHYKDKCRKLLEQAILDRERIVELEDGLKGLANLNPNYNISTAAVIHMAKKALKATTRAGRRRNHENEH